MSDGTLIHLESAFQGSKVFENVDYTDLYSIKPFGKKDERISKEHEIKGFKFDDSWDSEPKTAFTIGYTSMLYLKISKIMLMSIKDFRL